MLKMMYFCFNLAKFFLIFILKFILKEIRHFIKRKESERYFLNFLENKLNQNYVGIF
jgi:hypothetical protein